MTFPVTDCEVLSVDSGVIDCPKSGDEVPVLFVAVRVTGQPSPVNLAIRNPHRLVKDVPRVVHRSAVLNGGDFVPEHPKEEQ